MKIFRFTLLFLFVLLSDVVSAQQKVKLFGNKEPQTVKELTSCLTQNVSGDSSKVMAIYKWITHNVSYDYAVYMSGQPIRYQSPELVFKRKRTTCTGYSNLMVAMLGYAGIPAYTVEGFTQDFVLGLESTKLSSDHAWVAFSVNGNWHVADPTWDAGYIGIIPVVEKTEKELTFRQKLKRFRFRDLFRRKKKRKGTGAKKTITETKVTYKTGFLMQPSQNYIFVDPNEFMKTHLPNMAHTQMKTAPISVEQFCDSIHSLGDHYYRKNGGFDYNRINDTYYGLEIPDRLLWVSDSSLNYHEINHGDKALNAHNYLAWFNGGRTNVKHLLEKYSSIADTVIIHGNRAIRINRDEWKKKRVIFNEAFSREMGVHQQMQVQVNYIRSHVDRNREIYRKGRERMTQKELPALRGYESRIINKFGFSGSGVPPLGYDTLPKVKKMVEIIHAYRDSVLMYQAIERSKGPTYLVNLEKDFYSARKNLYDDAMLMHEGQFLNEWQITEHDKYALDSLKTLTKMMRDSINAFTGSRKSYSYLVKLEQELKRQAPIYLAMEKKDSILTAKEYHAYNAFIMLDLVRAEEEIVDYRIEHSKAIEKALKEQFGPESKNLGADMKALGSIRNMRQAYLTKMMNNKYNRSIKVYTIIVSNAKTWKSTYRQKLKNLQMRV